MVNTTHAAAVLDEKGLRPSPQRVRIYETLAGTKTHPPVDWIYRRLKGELPTLSRTTVYNTLGAFIEAGLAKPIYIEGEETRYDADMSDHGHARCRVCGGVFDFPIPAGTLTVEAPNGFRTEEVQLNCIGVCAACGAA